VFSILVSKDAIHPSSRLSYGDLLYGLPNTLVAVEAVLLSALFWYAFSAVEYSSSTPPPTEVGHHVNEFSRCHVLMLLLFSGESVLPFSVPGRLLNIFHEVCDRAGVC
jgi:hypothetical protein